MPRTLQLNIAEMLQGEWHLTDLNLLLVFQVNCPGCFIHALPLAITLQKKYANQLNLLGLSTAFEDFSLNTAENTRHWLTTGELIGETQKYFQQYGPVSLASPPSFPIGYDRLGPGSELFQDHEVALICDRSPSYQIWDAATQAKARSRLKQTLREQPLAPYTFTVNQLRGTPSWILFDANQTILAEWFGHCTLTEVEHRLQEAKSTTPKLTTPNSTTPAQSTSP